MTDFNFKQAVQQRYADRVSATAPIPEVDAYIFCTSSKYLGEKLFPIQSLIIKLVYRLWKKYPITPEEQKILDTLKKNWYIDLDLDNRPIDQIVEILILVLGRRSSKTATISFIQTYAVYSLICKGDPQKYYQIRNRNPIYCINCARDEKQAQGPFQLFKDNIQRIPFFQKYIDWSKNNESEIRLFTPADLYENEQIRKYNATARRKGEEKRALLEGSINVVASTTSAGSKRGKSIFLLIFDEYAHFDRAKFMTGGTTEEDIISEMPQTDYAMLKALAPATKDFVLPHRNIHDSLIVMISSPKEKGGEFYRHYCLAGGWEQANPQRTDRDPNYLMLQLSSWEANPKLVHSMFDADFRKDPVGSAMEYGAHFGEASNTFVDSTKIDSMIHLELPMNTIGEFGHQYIITVDPATKGDTYAVAWGHAEPGANGWMYIIDGITGFRAKMVTNDITGRSIKEPIDAAQVVNFISTLAQGISFNAILLEITFDQWNSLSSITHLRALGFPAVETFFTAKYKNEIYTNFLEKLNMDSVILRGGQPTRLLPGLPPLISGWVEQARLELKHLTKITSATQVTYAAPETGPVQTDDCADVIANLIHRLVLYQTNDRQLMKELFKQTGRPIQRSLGISPSMNSNLFPTSKGNRGLAAGLSRIRR